MATKSEDIRLQINNVKYKKGDGTLYLMAERLGWMPNTKNNFTISHKYSDIKMQKISPEGKTKIQLQIVLHTGDNTTFQFTNLEDRTAVKDALLQILPQFKGKMPKDRERKAMLLAKNPHLLQLYKDLVETKIVLADDFWSQFVDDTSDTAEVQMEQQDCGVSANFLSGIPLNGKQVKGTVTAETLYAILKTYPKVAKRHEELVPTKMSETDFWNKFFQSRYFNRDRTKDLFTDCARSDEKEFTSAVKQGAIDPFLDIDLFDDNVYQFSTTDAPSSSSHDNPNQLLITRFNQQSIRLLESLKAAESKTLASGEGSQETGSPKASTSDESSQRLDGSGPDQAATGTGSKQASFRANRRDWTFDDLAGQASTAEFMNSAGAGMGAHMNEVDRGLYSVVPKSQQQVALSPSMVKAHHDAIKAWEPQLTECLAAKDATEALKNLSPAGYLMRSSNTNRLVDTVPEDLQVKLRSTYFASNELLRHFWLCLPAVEPSLESKLMKIHETIKKFESSKIQPFYDSLPRDHKHLLDHLMRGQFKKASRKFDDWKNKRRQRETAKLRATP